MWPFIEQERTGRKVKYIPLEDRVVVRPQPGEKQSVGGIHLPDNAQRKPQRGEVLAVGPGRVTDMGVLLAMPVRVGDVVLYGEWSGNTVKDGADEILILAARDIMAVIER